MQPVPDTASTVRQRQAVGYGASPRAFLSNAIGGGLPARDPGFVAYAPFKD